MNLVNTQKEKYRYARDYNGTRPEDYIGYEICPRCLGRIDPFNKGTSLVNDCLCTLEEIKVAILIASINTLAARINSED